MTQFDEQVDGIRKQLAQVESELGDRVETLCDALDGAQRLQHAAESVKHVFTTLPAPVQPQIETCEHRYQEDELPPAQATRGALVMALLKAVLGIEHSHHRPRSVNRTVTIPLPRPQVIGSPAFRFTPRGTRKLARPRRDGALVAKYRSTRVIIAWERLRGERDLDDYELVDEPFEPIVVPAFKAPAHSEPAHQAYADQSVAVARDVLAIDAFLGEYEQRTREVETQTVELKGRAHTLEAAIRRLEITPSTPDPFARAQTTLDRIGGELPAKVAALAELDQRLGELRRDFAAHTAPKGGLP